MGCCWGVILFLGGFIVRLMGGVVFWQRSCLVGAVWCFGGSRVWGGRYGVSAAIVSGELLGSFWGGSLGDRSANLENLRFSKSRASPYQNINWQSCQQAAALSFYILALLIAFVYIISFLVVWGNIFLFIWVLYIIFYFCFRCFRFRCFYFLCFCFLCFYFPCFYFLCFRFLCFYFPYFYFLCFYFSCFYFLCFYFLCFYFPYFLFYDI